MNATKLKKQLRPADYRPGAVVITQRPAGVVWNTKTKRTEYADGRPVGRVRANRSTAVVSSSTDPAARDAKPKPLGFQLWTVLRSRATEIGERNDCSVIAAAAACSVSYERAHDACRKMGRSTGRGMLTRDIARAVESLGFDLLDVTAQIRRAGGRTVRTAGRLLQTAGHGTDTTGYLVFTRGHVAGYNVSIGHIIDWTADRQHRVVGVYRVNRRDSS